MSSYNELLALIDAYINQNGVQAITGQVLNGVLRAMVDQLGRGYAIMGAALPNTDPGTPDAPESWFASTPGTYTNFDGLTVANAELALLSYSPTDQAWTKQTLTQGIVSTSASVDNNVGTPSVTSSYVNGVLTFTFQNLKGNPGQDGDAAGFGTVSATVDGNVGTPGVSVQTSGPNTAKNMVFQFTNLKGETGVTSVVATVDNTSGSPQCAVSLSGGVLTLAFTGLKGAQGDTGSSVAYPFTIVNNLTTNDATQALSAAMGVQLESEVTQLEAKVDEYVETITSDEYTELLLDDDDKILESRDENGDKTFNCGVTFNGDVNGLPIPAIADNLTTNDATETLSAKQGYVLEGKKVDKTDLAELIEPIESSLYSEVLMDSSDKMLESRDENGKKTIYTDVHIKGEVTGDKLPEIIVKPGTEFVDTVIDASEKVVEGTTKDGKKVFFGGIATEDGTMFKPSPLYGKKWVIFGDSFTNGGSENGTIDEDGQYKGFRCVYPYIVANRTGLDVVKFFEGGRTLAFPATPGAFTNSICNPSADWYYQNIPEDADYITIYLGINDSHHAPGSGGGDGEDNTGEIPLGTITDNTTATYYGAWNVVLSWLIENRPFAHIGIIVSNGCDTPDYRTAQIAIARKYGIPFIDLNGDDRTPFMIRSQNTDIPSAIRTIRTQKQAVDYDGTQTGTVNTHPNRDAHLFESTFIENFLKSL